MARLRSNSQGLRPRTGKLRAGHRVGAVLARLRARLCFALRAALLVLLGYQKPMIVNPSMTSNYRSVEVQYAYVETRSPNTGQKCNK